MISRLKEQITAAKTRYDALEVLHIEAQNVKIKLINKGYKVITTPGEPGPDFEERLDENQPIAPEDIELIEYFKTIRGLKESVDKIEQNSSDDRLTGLQKELIGILQNKPATIN